MDGVAHAVGRREVERRAGRRAPGAGGAIGGPGTSAGLASAVAGGRRRGRLGSAALPPPVRKDAGQRFDGVEREVQQFEPRLAGLAAEANRRPHGFPGGSIPREAHRERRPLRGGEDAERLQGAGCPRLHFHRHDPVALGHHIVHLRVAAPRVPQPVPGARRFAAVPGREVLPDELLRDPTLVREGRGVRLRGHRRRHAGEVVHQPHIEEDQLEGALDLRRAERNPRAVAVRHPVADTGADEALDRPARRFGARLGVEPAVPHPVSHRSGDRREQSAEPAEVGVPRVLGKVVGVGSGHRAVDPRHFLHRAGLAVAEHRLGQAADEQVFAQAPGKPLVRRVSRRRLRIEVGDARRERRFEGAEELGERHRAEVEVLDPPDRHREGVVGERELEQRPGGDHRNLGALLVEVAQGGQRAGRGLDLVEEQDRPPEPPIDPRFDPGDDPVGVEAGEGPVEVGVPFEVDFEEGPTGGLREPPHQRRLPDLPGAADHERLTAVLRQPAAQDGLGAAFHGGASS